MEPIAWKMTRDAGWTKDDENCVKCNGNTHPADERKDNQRHVPSVAVYVDGEIPEEGEQNCRNDVDEKHHKHRPLVVLCVCVCFFFQ